MAACYVVAATPRRRAHRLRSFSSALHTSSKDVPWGSTTYFNNQVQPFLLKFDYNKSTKQQARKMTGISKALLSQDLWHATIAEVVPAIVSIVTSTTSEIGVHRKGERQATGFVVSTEHGFIITNRHVIGAGPTDAYAIFGKGACKCPITPCYVDPAHDFTFCKYDVTDLEGFKVEQIELKPELAKVGLEVRVIGNDTGEVLSILTGIISRLDRNPPSGGDARRYTFVATFDSVSNANYSNGIYPSVD